jgi:4-hydroxyphenylpyruvate dioxygenase
LNRKKEINPPNILFVEIYVGMAKMVSWWHQMALGFTLKGIRERKGKYGDEITYWLRQGDANLLITSALDPAAHDVVSFVDRHGNSIKRFGIEIDSIEDTVRYLKYSKAIISSELRKDRFENEYSASISIKIFDDNEISFVERRNCTAPLAGFKLTESKASENYIKNIDHLASVVRINEAEYWNEYLSSILNLNLVQTIGEEFFANLLTGMKMFVLSSPVGKFNKVIVEPLPEKEKKSQVDIFLSNHFGNGIQHLAFEVDDLISTVEKLKGNGVNFTPVPAKYYEDLNIQAPELPIEMLRKANILCEKEDDKILLQVFTEPIGDRPTLFYEFIQRINDYQGFGATNVKQLFKSLELHLSND